MMNTKLMIDFLVLLQTILMLHPSLTIVTLVMVDILK